VATNVDVKIANLKLDTGNPRIAKADNQRQAYERILIDQGEKLVVLAKHMVKYGMNPAERILVVADGEDPKGKTFISVEGNRRTAVLKILKNSTVLDDMEGIDAGVVRGLKAAALSKDSRIAPLEEVECVAFDTKKSAETWIELRHTGENGGSGVVSWSSIQQRRFQGEDSPALQVINFVLNHGGLSDDDKAAVDKINLTTLERIIDSVEMRSRLGFNVVDKRFVSGLPVTELLKPLRKIVRDIAVDKMKVANVMNKEKRKEYVDGFDPASVPDLSRMGTVRPIASVTAADFKPRSTGKGKRKPADPSTRKTLVPKAVQINFGKHTKIAKIFRELQYIKIDGAENAVAVLFRVFLELSIDRFLEKNGIALAVTTKSGHKSDKSLRSKVQEAIPVLVASGRNEKNYKGVVRAQAHTSSPLHTEVLNGYVHNQFTLPTAANLRHAWDEAQQFFEDLWA